MTELPKLRIRIVRGHGTQGLLELLQLAPSFSVSPFLHSEFRVASGPVWPKAVKLSPLGSFVPLPFAYRGPSVEEMSKTAGLRHYALRYHQSLPSRLWKYLNGRGIPDPLIHRYLLGWDGRRITIPVTNRAGKVAFFKLAKDPEDASLGPKMLASAGSYAELYGWDRILSNPSEILICEGEFDRLVLEANGLQAVTSTAGAGTFRAEWAEAFKDIPQVYVCFDRDEVGRAGAQRVAQLIRHARIVQLPEEVGEGGDVTDFFIRLGRSREEFLRLLEAAQVLPDKEQADRLDPQISRSRSTTTDELDRLKSQISIEDFIARYVPLRGSGRNYIGRCPFHEDHNPSFVVYPQSQSFYCFGCQAHGDIVSFLMRAETLSFPEALKVLREVGP